MSTDLLSQNFTTLVTAPQGIPRLRELILQLAVQGKLTTQDPADETAGVLLKRIEKEKTRLIVNGDIKRTDSFLEVATDEYNYEIPNGWKWTRIGNLVANSKQDIVDGPFGSDLHSNEYVDFGVPVIRLQNVQRNEFINKNIRFITSEKAEYLSRHNFVAGDILITKLGDPVGKACIVPDYLKYGIFVADIIRLRLNSQFLDARYINFMINSPFISSKFNGLIKGITRQRVNLTKVREMVIPLPPLAEQHRIVEKVDRLMVLCDTLDDQQRKEHEQQIRHGTAALAALQNAKDLEEVEKWWRHIAKRFDLILNCLENITVLRSTILQLAVKGQLGTNDPTEDYAGIILERIKSLKGDEDPATSIENACIKKYQIPKNWILCRLGDILIFGPKNGVSPVPVDFKTSTKSLALSATSSGKFLPQFYKYIDLEFEADSHIWLSKGDILVQRSNTEDYVGIAAVYEGNPNEFVYPDLMMKIVIHPNIDYKYIHICINNPISREFIRDRAVGTSSSMKKINQDILRDLCIPLPPLAEQHRIVAMVDALMALCDKLEAQIREREAAQERFAKAIINKIVNAPISTVQT